MSENKQEIIPVENTGDISPRTDAAENSFTVSELPEAEAAEINISTPYGKVVARAMNLMMGVLPTLKSNRKADRIYHDQRVDKLHDLCKTIRDEIIDFIKQNPQEPVTIASPFTAAPAENIEEKGAVTNAGDIETDQQGTAQKAASQEA